MKNRQLSSLGIFSIWLLTWLVGCGGGFFRVSMEGKDGSALAGKLAIHPSSLTLLVGASQYFSATGGDGVYQFSLLEGTGEMETDVYTAPAEAGTERVRVTDGSGATAEAIITVKLTYSPDYKIVAWPVFPTAGEAEAGFTGSFVIANIAAEPGAKLINWTVYLSHDKEFDSLDLVVDSGALAALPASSFSEALNFSGNWPAAPSDYYLIIKLEADDDAVTSNNTAFSSPITVSGGKDRPNYGVESITVPAYGLCTAGFSGSFDISNNGDGDGAESLGWEVYLSADDKLDDSDIWIDKGSLDDGLAAGSTPSVGFTGSFPAQPGTYYFIVTLAAFDNLNDTQDFPSSAIIISGPKYVIDEIITPSASCSAGQSFSGRFTITNTGHTDGLRELNWQLYASTTDAIGPGASLIDTGSCAALNAGDTTEVTYSGSWPVDAGSYCLIVRLQAPDDPNTVPLASAPVTVVGPDYSVSNIGLPSVLSIGETFEGSFTIANSENAGDGNQGIYWSVYSSNTDAIGPGTSLIATGSCAALNAGDTTEVTYSGSWPVDAGSYYLIVRLQAPDDPNTAPLASVLVTVVGPDYSVSNIGLPSVFGAGETFEGSFTIANSENAGNGNQGIDWSVYASTDEVIGPGDMLLASGTTIALDANGEVEIEFSGQWPVAAGSYYLIVSLSARDDTNATNNLSISEEIEISE